MQIWHGLSRWHASESGLGVVAASAVLVRARAAMPDCTMLHFAAAELEEGRGNIEAARTLYEEMVQVCHGSLPISYSAWCAAYRNKVPSLQHSF